MRGHLFLKAQILPLNKSHFYNSISFYYAEKLKNKKEPQRKVDALW